MNCLWIEFVNFIHEIDPIGLDVRQVLPQNISSAVVGIAQLVEHRVVIPCVAGSSPVTHPIEDRFCGLF